MSGVVQVAQDLIEFYSRMAAHDKQFGAFTFEQSIQLKSALNALLTGDYYEVETGLFDFAESMKDQYNDLKLGDIVLSEDCRPPSSDCFVFVPSEGTGYLTHIDPHLDELTVQVSVITGDSESYPLSVGAYSLERSKKNSFWFDKAFATAQEQNMAMSTILHVAMVFEVINQPRFVVRDAAGSRQSRKHMHRKHGISTGAWHKIEWNLGEPVKAKSDSDKGGWRMPLHYTRGHWRKAQEHWDDVVIRKDNQPYKWIDGFWSGHPAYGVKKSYHAPKLGKKEEDQ